MADFLLKDGEKIIFTGDSVTDAGRKRPIGEGIGEGVGTGYVREIENMINVFYPERNIWVTNTGVGGNTSRDLLARFSADVIDLNPDYLVICIGFNDVWRQFDEPAVKSEHVYLDEYESNIKRMANLSIEKGIKVIFMTPYYLELNEKDVMRKKMDEYGTKTKKVASELNLPCIDLQKAFNRLLKYKYSAQITWDRVHPNNIGSTLIANEILKFMNFDFDRLK